MNNTKALALCLILMSGLFVVSCKKEGAQPTSVPQQKEKSQEQIEVEKKAEALLLQNGFKKISPEEAARRKLTGKKIQSAQDFKDLQEYLSGGIDKSSLRIADDVPPSYPQPIKDEATAYGMVRGGTYAEFTWVFSKLKAKSYPSIFVLVVKDWKKNTQDVDNATLLFQGANVGSWSWEKVSSNTIWQGPATHQVLGVATETITVVNVSYTKNFRVFVEVYTTSSTIAKANIDFRQFSNEN